MASLFGGLGRGLGAAALGYGTGERQGEAEAFRRRQIEEQNALKLMLAQQKVRPEKEELPYEVQSFLDTRSRIYGPSGDYRERLDWEGSGMERVHGLVSQALARGGGKAARLTLAIANQAEGTDTSGLQAELGQMIGGGGAQPPAPPSQIPEGGFGSVGAFLGAQPQQAPPSFAQQVQPSLKAGYQYGPTRLEEARTGLAGANEARVRALTPEEVLMLQRKRENIGFREDLQQREFNLKAAQGDFDNALRAAQQRINAGQTDYRLMSQTWGELLDASVRLHYEGGNPSDFLKPLLMNRGPFGATMPNPEAISRYLSLQGVPQNDIQAIIQGATPGGGAFMPPSGGATGGASGGGMTFGGVQQPGGPPVLPGVGGAAPTGMSAMDAGQAIAQQAGFRITSTNTGRHNEGSAHYENRAFDVGVRGKSPNEVKQFMAEMASRGYRVRDERKRPPGQKVWDGAHIHIEVPEGMAAPGDVAAPAGAPQATRTTPGQAPTGMVPGAERTINEALTPQGAPASPYAADTLEGRIWGLYTQGQSADAILQRFRGTPYEQVAQQVIDQANDRQRQRRFSGVPAPDRFGARAPEGTNFAGTLGYPEQGIPQITTTPLEPSVGFGSRAPVPAKVIDRTTGEAGADAPTAPPAPPAAPPQTVTAPPAPAPDQGGPPLTGAQAMLGIKLPSLSFPKLFTGPQMTGVQEPAPGGPPAARIPESNRGAKARDAASGPRVKPPTPPTMASEPRFKGPEANRARKNLASEVQRYKRHPLGPTIGKWLSKHKIGNPATQRAVYEDVIGTLAPSLLRQNKTEAWIKQNLLTVLDQYLQPAS